MTVRVEASVGDVVGEGGDSGGGRAIAGIAGRECGVWTIFGVHDLVET